jgi:hypothetical protein
LQLANASGLQDDTNSLILVQCCANQHKSGAAKLYFFKEHKSISDSTNHNCASCKSSHGHMFKLWLQQLHIDIRTTINCQIVKSAWPVCGSGPTVCSPDDDDAPEECPISEWCKISFSKMVVPRQHSE